MKRFFSEKWLVSSIAIGAFAATSLAHATTVSLSSLFPNETTPTIFNSFDNNPNAPLTTNSVYYDLYTQCNSYQNSPYNAVTNPVHCDLPTTAVLGVINRSGATDAQKAMNRMRVYCPQGESFEAVTIQSGQLKFDSTKVPSNCIGDINVSYYKASSLTQPFLRCDAEVIQCGANVGGADCPKPSSSLCYPVALNAPTSNGTASPANCNAGQWMVTPGNPPQCNACDSGTYNPSAGTNTSCTACGLSDIGGAALNSNASSYTFKSQSPLTSPRDCSAASFTCTPGYQADVQANTCTCMMNGSVTTTPPSTPSASDGSYTVTLSNPTPAWSPTVSDGTPHSFTANTITVTGLSGGNHSLVISDRPANPTGTCSKRFDVTLGSRTCSNSYSLSATGTRVSTYGGSDGTLSSTAGGGFSPTTYTLTSSVLTMPQSNSTGSFSGLKSGSYNVQAVDGASCQQSATVFVDGPPKPCSAQVCYPGEQAYVFSEVSGFQYTVNKNPQPTGADAPGVCQTANGKSPYVACSTYPPSTSNYTQCQTGGQTYYSMSGSCPL